MNQTVAEYAVWPVPVQRPLMLLASDGSAIAGFATRATVLVAASRGMDVRVITVLPPQLFFPPLSDGGIGVPIGEYTAENDFDHRKRIIREQIATTGFHPDSWPLDLEVGPAATIIAREARRHNASMITMGLRPHSGVERWLRDETTLRVIRESRVPVLAVAPGLAGLPRRLAVAVDFSRASLRAARAGIALLAPGSSVFVVYVQPEQDRTEQHEGATVIYTQGIVAAFARLRRELQVPAGVQVEAVMLRGQPAPEIMSFAERADVDLVAVGSHRHPFLARLLLGSVTSKLVRDARRSLIVSPPSPPRAGGA